ncbi:GDSL-type esterase/lipase family protein [Massilia phyllosphaerae]|uniref:GDSL-type esterase/lipase family protein n=1 Tax=Massilia phyllosphaerae TaxID=3106034 RepID=UPI002B1CCF60|nr:GDSL-type esterase/lipase family protein [Massilia sp. SGZ-792]
MRTLNWMRRLLPRLAFACEQEAWNPTRRALILAAGLASLLAGGLAQADDLNHSNGGSSKWAATWATSIQSAYVAPTTPQGAAVPGFDPQPDLSFALPNATVNGASNQTFRMIVKPDLWAHTIRVRFSNVFGTRPLTFSHAAVALQAFQANIARGTSVPLRFRGNTSVTIPPGQQVFSDPVALPFVSDADADRFAGRNLAISFAVDGATGPASYHGSAFTTSYISAPNAGDQVLAEDDIAFPYSTTSWFFVSEVDVLVPRDTLVVVAFGDSITDGTFSTLNGNDRWANVMARQLHKRLGAKVSVVNAGIGGNGVVALRTGQPATQRVARDVIGLSGANLVVWLEGINDLGGGQLTPPPVIAGYRQVAASLRSAGLGVIGATITSSYVPSGQVPANSPLAAVSPTLAAQYGNAQTDAYRRTLNRFILNSGLFDATADFDAVTTDPATGTLLAPYVPNSEGSAGDYLHPNRAGYQAMGVAAANAVSGWLARSAVTATTAR